MLNLVANDKMLAELLTVEGFYRMADAFCRFHAPSGFGRESEGKL